MNATDPVSVDPVQDISDWLIGQGLDDGGYDELLFGFCERLNDGGILVQRSMVAMRTLHPSIDARGFVWHRGGEVTIDEFATDRGPTDGFLASPIAYLLQNRHELELRRPLIGPDVVTDFPVLEDLIDQGVTDYLMIKVPFKVASLSGYESGMIVSWASDAPGGFSETCVTALRRLAPRLALVIQNRLLREVTINVLDAYVGHQAGERILSGEISRGSLQQIDAAILLMDFRGFTALSDRTDGAHMAALLNEYFERIVPPVLDRGGEILKFMGDGVLATFSLKDLQDDMVCLTALNAAIEALTNVETWNAERAASGAPVMALDVAVHLGRVQFGNVGAGDRLDFTVIGSAVNEASRIEALSDELDQHLLVSEAFAAAATQCTGRLESVGRHRLRGVSRDQELFTVDY